jgi:tetratricopeptide (TPR) repeat protein
MTGEDHDAIAALCDLGRALTLEGLDAQARVVWEGLTELAPALELPHRVLAILALREHRLADADASASQAIERADSAAARLVRAQARLHAGRYREAQDDLAACQRLPAADRVLARARALGRKISSPRA